MPLLTPDDYDDVRAAIDLSLVGDQTTVSDAVIDLELYEPAAEAEVMRRVPNADSLTGDALAAAQRATIYLTAARLVLSLPTLSAEKIDTYSYTREVPDPTAQAATLRFLASTEIALAGGTGNDLPTQFTRACAPRYRGASAWRR